MMYKTMFVLFHRETGFDFSEISVTVAIDVDVGATSSAPPYIN